MTVTIDTAKTVLVLRTCAADGASYNGFKHPVEVGATDEQVGS